MKLKTSHAPAGNLKRLALAAALIVAPVANAQNYSYFYGQNVQGGGYTSTFALPSGFDVEQFNENTNVRSSGATASSSAPDETSLGITGFSTTVSLGTGWGQHASVPAGFEEVVTSVTMYLWVSPLAPLGGTQTFQIYSGINGRDGSGAQGSGAALIGDIITLTEPTSEDQFVALTIPASVWETGFSISKSGSANGILWNTITETGTASQRPGFSVNTTVVPVPEPTTGLLLGGLAMMGLIRRKRA